MAGIGLRYCLGFSAPSVMDLVIPAQLPSLHSNLFFVKSGLRGVSVAFAPWQAVQVAPALARDRFERRSEPLLVWLRGGKTRSSSRACVGIGPLGWFGCGFHDSPAGAIRLGHGVNAASPVFAPAPPL
jgi:hypothetical protein